MAQHTAAVSWWGPTIRVYSSDGHEITERCWDGGGEWYTGLFKDAGQDVSATGWLDPVRIRHVRVYASNDGVITEWCWDGDVWYKGLFKDARQNVSATSWLAPGGLKHHIRVYASNNGVTTEWCWDGDVWYKGNYTG